MEYLLNRLNRVIVLGYRRFETIYHSPIQVSSCTRRILFSLFDPWI